MKLQSPMSLPRAAPRSNTNSASSALEPLWLEWLALGGMLVFAAWLMGARGVWGLLLRSDPTGITLIIVVLFCAATPWCGARSRKGDEATVACFTVLPDGSLTNANTLPKKLVQRL